MSAVVLIPARFDSTRFPGKPLAPLKGLPVIQHVYRNSLLSERAADVIVATDSETIFETVLAFGGKAVMTSAAHLSGTDRIAEAVRSLDKDYDIIVNVQGDEPLIRPEMIDAVISLLDDSRASLGTLVKKIVDPEEIFDPNVVKAVCDEDGFALYFSRAPIPYYRDAWKAYTMQRPALRGQPSEAAFCCYKHIGIYSYRKEALLALTALAPTEIELAESLEQLRALGNGYKIKVQETSCETFGVDTPEDLERIEKCLNISL
ncbi:MAG: 3-deoxy-manno-octulosonate cytidylyltransferase [Nitrospirae bacterium]|nr:MAG: 3-deoxy-manno-octulosonate cytidylyltransferase [Nitrospirota bacterium]